MRNGGKNRQRRGLPPPCGIHPAVLGVPASSCFRPLARWGHIDGMKLLQHIPTSLVDTLFYHQGLTLVRRCSQLSRARHPAAGTPLGQSRPGHGNCPAIGPAARIAWCGGSTRSHSKGHGPNLGLTQFQPRTQREVLRGERPKWLFVHFGQSKWTPAERVSPLQGSKAAPHIREKLGAVAPTI